jgi:acyl dehydratase
VTRLSSVAEMKAVAGSGRYVSEWLEVDQSRINRFADATNDHQWIHVDEERARRESPFGGPIAHGFLTLSLVPMWLAQCVPLEQRMGVNYGLNKVRFVSPVPAGARLRATFVVETVTDIADNGVQVVWLVTIEREASDKPVCVAEFITRHYF